MRGRVMVFPDQMRPDDGEIDAIDIGDRLRGRQQQQDVPAIGAEAGSCEESGASYVITAGIRQVGQGGLARRTSAACSLPAFGQSARLHPVVGAVEQRRIVIVDVLVAHERAQQLVRLQAPLWRAPRRDGRICRSRR